MTMKTAVRIVVVVIALIWGVATLVWGIFGWISLKMMRDQRKKEAKLQRNQQNASLVQIPMGVLREIEITAARRTPPWQSLTRQQVVNVLMLAQQNADDENIICVGCGRVFEPEYMELDHKLPQVDGGSLSIMNCVLLCAVCNRRKGAKLTLNGLTNENRKIGWMVSAKRAESALRSVKDAIDQLERDWDNPAVQKWLG